MCKRSVQMDTRSHRQQVKHVCLWHCAAPVHAVRAECAQRMLMGHAARHALSVLWWPSGGGAVHACGQL